VRGFPVGKNDYLEIEEDDLNAIEIESSHTIDIESFIPRGEIDPVYLDSSNYLTPNDKVAEEAFAVIREAMAAEGVAGLGRAVISRRERLLVLEPRGKGILATVLHYNYEVRDDKAYFEDMPEIKIPAEMLDLAKHIIQTKMGHFDISKFEDRYENALVEMIRAKQAGRPVTAAAPREPAKIINLMDALRKSIAAEKGGLKQPASRGSAQPSGKTPKKENEPARQAAQSRAEPRRVAPVEEDREKPAGPASKPKRKGAGRS
jgi:DNA end-binding protein Ku